VKLAIGADHAGYDLKVGLLAFLRAHGHEVDDFGCGSTESCDHADFGIPVAMAVACRDYDGGVPICGTGQGMAICANKVVGIRATICLSAELAQLARAHNDSNVLVLPGRFMTPADAEATFETWAATPFEGGRHARRMDKISDYERGHRGDSPDV
jgi:RpiB/LacA/LacB family sugar-phosphate isomerase